MPNCLLALQQEMRQHVPCEHLWYLLEPTDVQVVPSQCCQLHAAVKLLCRLTATAIVLYDIQKMAFVVGMLHGGVQNSPPSLEGVPPE